MKVKTRIFSRPLIRKQFGFHASQARPEVRDGRSGTDGLSLPSPFCLFTGEGINDEAQIRATRLSKRYRSWSVKENLRFQNHTK